MTIPACTNCHHGHYVRVEDIGMMWRCFRPQTFKDRLSPQRGVAHPGVFGRICIVERDAIPEPHRADGDKCGVQGAHWMVRT